MIASCVELDAAVRRIRERFGAQAPPGIVIAAVDGDRVVAAVDGVRQRAGTGPAADLPQTVGTSFDLASVTKVVATTTVLARLVGLGRLDVDDPVERYLASAPTAGETTLRHLLTHRAGLWEWWPLYAGSRSPSETLDGLPLRYRLDERRAYSDLGFVLLGRVVEAVTGESLDRAVAELVTSPLGLRSTRFGHPRGDEVAANATNGDAIEERMIATGDPYPVGVEPGAFAGWRRGTIVGEVSDGNAFHAFGGISGHAGLFSTVDDLLRVAAAWSDGDFLPPQIRDAFATPGPDPEQSLGWRRDAVRVGGGRRSVLWHPGYTGTGLGWLPDAGRGVVLATNRLHAPGDPVGTADLWRIALDAAGEWFAAQG